MGQQHNHCQWRDQDFSDGEGANSKGEGADLLFWPFLSHKLDTIGKTGPRRGMRFLESANDCLADTPLGFKVGGEWW